MIADFAKFCSEVVYSLAYAHNVTAIFSDF